MDYPKDEALIFDVETLVLSQNRPIIAVAASSEAWYTWCSHAFFIEDYNGSSPLMLDDLIPLESDNAEKRKTKKRVVIGHNVGFDRGFIKEQYYQEVTFKVCLMLKHV